jgi:hypothetical protein
VELAGLRLGDSMTSVASSSDAEPTERPQELQNLLAAGTSVLQETQCIDKS